MKSDSWHLSSTLKRIYLPLWCFRILTKGWLILVSSLYEMVIAHSLICLSEALPFSGVNMNIKVVTDTVWTNLHDFLLSLSVLWPGCLLRQRQGWSQESHMQSLRPNDCTMTCGGFSCPTKLKKPSWFSQMKWMSDGEKPCKLVRTGPPCPDSVVLIGTGRLSSSSHHLNVRTGWRLNQGCGRLTPHQAPHFRLFCWTKCVIIKAESFSSSETSVN